MGNNLHVPDYMSFEDFVTILPTLADPPGVPSEAFKVVTEAGPFVAPEFIVYDKASAPKVTFVSARGATGKSTMAEQLSYRQNAPLWSLGKDKAVSGDTLAARLSSYLGTVQPLTDAPARVPLVIVDAMDEARLRVTGVSWDEFMSSLVEYVNAGVHLLILGRQRTIEDVWYSLVDKIAEISWYEISHFTPDKQSEYVDLRALNGTAASPSPMYEKAKGTVLSALNGGTDAALDETFAGYAPVLDAVAKLLRPGQNYQSVAHDFEDAGAGGSRLKILRKILETLLDREQEKVHSLALQMGLNAANAYGADEQIAWLASDLLGADSPALEWCPDGQRADYRDQIKDFLHDHPFRDGDRWASPVFSNFVAAQAWEVARPEALYMVSASSGLLFEFVATAEEGDSVIEEYQFAALHASVLAGQWADADFSVIIEDHDRTLEGQKAQEVHASVLLTQTGTHVTTYDAIVILSTPGLLALTSPLVNLDVVFDGDVRVSSLSASIDLGPDVLIHARSVELLGASLQVSRDASSANTKTGPSVEFEITTHFSSTASLIGSVGPAELSIGVPASVTLTYPWVQYRSSFEEETTSTSPDDRARRFLNKLMSLARKHGRGQRAVALKNLEGRQSLSREEFNKAVDVLVSKGVAERSATHLFISPSWDKHRYDGKGRPGMTSFEDKADAWTPVVMAISDALT